MLAPTWSRSVGLGLLMSLVWCAATSCSDDVASTVWRQNGDAVDRDVIESYVGDEHCDYDEVTVLALVWPPGEVGGQRRTYVRDADGTLEDRTISVFEADAELPEDAEFSEFYSSVGELWFAPEDRNTIAYIVSPDGGRVEAWPRTRGILGCD